MSILIVTKDSQKSAILPIRSAYRRKFDVGVWTELRIGMFFSLTSSSDDDSAAVSETVTQSSASDRFGFGIKSDDGNLPQQSGCTFFGTTTRLGSVQVSYGGQADTNERNIRDINLPSTVRAYYGVTSGTTLALTEVVGTTVLNMKPANYGGGYSTFFGFRFVINDLGTATQTVDVYTRTAANLSSTSIADLRLNVDAAHTLVASAATANDGATAYPIPTCFYLQNPFTGIRFKLHNHMVKKYA